jgi:dTDP-4-amino-4,6-dideoxygalactose transaminase
MSKTQYAIPGTRLAQEYRSLRSELDLAIARVLQKGAYCPDAEAVAFEREFAAYVGVRYAVAVNAGSAAVMLALMALGTQPGDEVISVANVDISASAPISHAGGRAVWVDIDPRTYNLDPAGLGEAITPRTRAIIAVHMYGNPTDLASILSIAEAHGIPVVEDGALGPGAFYSGRKVGSLGRIGCFSFCPGKVLGALGQAGIVVTDDPALAERVRVLGNYGLEPRGLEAIVRGEVGARFVASLEGYNCRMDELQAAVLRVKLRHLDEMLERRRENAAVYRETLADLEPEHLLLPQDTPGSEPVYRMFVIRCPRRDELQRFLATEGIWTGLAYVPPLHLQPAYEHLGYRPGAFPRTEQVAEELLCLPTVPELSTQEVRTVADRIRTFLTRAAPAR